MQILTDDQKEYVREAARRELARRKLVDFTQWTYSGYEVNDHHDRYAAALDSFAAGRIKNLMVFMPPQHGKSELCSRRLPAKMLGDNPDLKIALVSYNHSFAAKFNRDVSRIIDDNRYGQLYPETKLSGRGVSGSWLRNSEEFEVVNHTGGLITVGVGGGLTGRPVDVGIIDDPYKDAMDAWSSTVRQSVQDWYDTVFKTRLHNGSQQLITLTRWHPDDLAGTIVKREPEKWHVVIFPAIKLGPPTDDDPRQEGTALWENRHSLERLLEVKRQNPHVFESLYQQNPKPAEGLLFPIESLKRFEMREIVVEEHRVQPPVIAAIDLADRGTDYYCMLVAYIVDRKVYIADCIFTQAPIDKTEPLTIDMLIRHQVKTCRIESNFGGEIYCNTLRKKFKAERAGFTVFDPVFTTANKETRILLSSGQVKDNLYFRSDYTHGSDYAKFMDNLTGYLLQGKNEHDDAADTVTMLVEMLTKGAYSRKTDIK